MKFKLIIDKNKEEVIATVHDRSALTDRIETLGLFHAGVLSLDYLNRWIPRDLTGIGIFAAIFAAGYAVV